MRVNSRFENPALDTDDQLFGKIVRCLAEAAVLSNVAYLEANPRTPALYKAGVRYRNEPAGLPDELLDIPVVMRRRHGDCFHLTAWRVAELRKAGERARVRVTWARRRNGKGRVFHVLVRRADGRIEDPSRLLGMGKPEFAELEKP